MLKSFVKIAAGVALLAGAAPALAQQIQEVDPNQADAWQAPADTQEAAPAPGFEEPAPPADEWAPVGEEQQTVDTAPETAGAAEGTQDSIELATTATEQSRTVPREDLINAAEGVFGRGAQGLARLVENILRDQGEPVAYIAGQEASGAFVFGVRYGSGVMRHQIEGERTVYWTGPSVGFDVGADANKVFVLVYNLHDSQDLFRRYPAGEGHAYFVGGFSAQYMRRGDVVLIPIRLGVGLRLGVNAGYMRFSERNRWLPF
jgi:hypothetical protein